jgi:hypothetical protein
LADLLASTATRLAGTPHTMRKEIDLSSAERSADLYKTQPSRKKLSSCKAAQQIREAQEIFKIKSNDFHI